ncbi:hypothetical protein CKN73_13070 [Carnobacterium divergens]|uniref:hypothetical protein n=1 Tax=Carnobacterium divergens TaxID=2748 RepID=UPI0010720BAB|nr:hypothetical protein [Carnobacterium divergens]TFJ41956.1 hypothetical protein CKN77_04475 [Carnobacterium divergens]TFJ47332.1 hypothetical protein CKN73_13070 [Carnobacterium divergens]TFJ51392.1 hypothetical protein CKN83_13040 [Carnobacterium divergens]TFJ61825.1 hypothetical protein CKN89_05480 [Carnobacterium divergens]TFJ68351.1 hypothetical protein CKN91_13020 [Carnobacterium divergens]
MKINKFLFLISCIFLVGCSNGVSKSQKSDYQDTLKRTYPKYNYSYFNKNGEYEIEFTEDIEEVLIDNKSGQKYEEENRPYFVKTLTKNFSEMENSYNTMSLNEVFDGDGKFREDILKILKTKGSWNPTTSEYISGDIMSLISNKKDANIYLDFKMIVGSSLILVPNEDKIIKVLTDEPYIFDNNGMFILAQNTDSGVYSLIIHDQDTFNFLEKVYSSKNNKKDINKLFSSLLAANESILLAMDFGATNNSASIEEMNQRFTILDNFLNKFDISNNERTIYLKEYLYEYKKTGNIYSSMLALKSASDNRTNLINNILSSSGSTDNKEKQIETKLPTATYPDKTNESIYRLDGIESKYTYDSSLVKNAIKKVKKMSEMTIKNNYIVKENEIGQLYINVYSPNKQDEIIENYVFDPYTKNIAASEDFDNSSEDSVQVIISEAIEAIEKQTSYSTNNQMPYIMSGYVTDDGFIAIDISISDENNPGGVIKQDQAIYDPNTHSISEFPQNSPVEDNDGSNEEELIEEAINKIEQSTGYIQDNPYVYDAYIEEGTVIVEVRAAGAGDSGTMSIVDRFQYVPQNEQIYVYDSVSGRYKPY